MFRTSSVVALLSVAALSGATHAGTIVNVSDPSGLKAEAEFTLTGPTTLTIRLRNISTGVPVGFTSADQILTGVSWDFGLPGGNGGEPTITAGSVLIGPNSASVNFSTGLFGAGADVSREWGYGNSPSGMSFQNFLSALAAGSTQLPGTNRDGPDNLNGPQGGLIPKPAPIVDLGGLGAIQDEIIATLTLSTAISNLDFLNTNLVRFEFGSDAKFLTTPTPGASALLLIGGAIAGRRRRN